MFIVLFAAARFLQKLNAFPAVAQTALQDGLQWFLRKWNRKLKMKNNEVVIKKIALKPFINILLEAYDEGVEFIDIQAVLDPASDRINVIARNDSEEDSLSPPLREKDIDSLIS